MNRKRNMLAKYKLCRLAPSVGSVLFSALIVFLGWTAPEFSRPSLGCRLLVGD
jgi:hypothetical protein